MSVKIQTVFTEAEKQHYADLVAIPPQKPSALKFDNKLNLYAVSCKVIKPNSKKPVPFRYYIAAYNETLAEDRALTYLSSFGYVPASNPKIRPTGTRR